MSSAIGKQARKQTFGKDGGPRSVLRKMRRKKPRDGGGSAYFMKETIGKAARHNNSSEYENRNRSGA